MKDKKNTPRKITRDLFIAVLLVSAAVIVPVVYLSSQAQRDISEQFIDNATNRAVAEFRTMAESVSATLGLVRDWGESELFAINDTETLNRLLFPVLDREKLLNGISVADMDGNSYFVRRIDERLRTSQIDADKSPRQAVITLWDAETKEELEVKKEASDYDPRSRPWFTPALSKPTIFWSDPYKFYTSGKVGITASISYSRKKDDKQVVVAFDVLLDELFTEMHKFAPSDNSRIFIFRRDARLYIPESEEGAADFMSMGLVQDSLVREIYAKWAGEAQRHESVVTVSYEGATWWGGFVPIDSEYRSTWICVMVPEQDILGHAGKRRLFLGGIGLGVILFAVIVAFWLSRRYGRKDEEDEPLFNPNNPHASVLKLVEAGESSMVEFKATMRMNLHAKKPGKEIELAWLKGVAAFLNTDGGILLLGVTDSGEISGLEQDVFENEDKCKLHFKNLVAQHIGAELSKYINFQIVPVGEKTVGVVLCERSASPVFLKTNKDESFYIRNGPSSDELPVSKALHYIKNRK